MDHVSGPIIDPNVIEYIAEYAALADYISQNPQFIWSIIVHGTATSIALLHKRYGCSPDGDASRYSRIVQVNVNDDMSIDIVIIGPEVVGSPLIPVTREELLPYLETAIMDTATMFRGTLTVIPIAHKAHLLIREVRRLFGPEVIDDTIRKMHEATKYCKFKFPVMMPRISPKENVIARVPSTSWDRTFVWQMIRPGKYYICKSEVFSMTVVILIVFDIQRTKKGRELSEPVHRVRIYDEEEGNILVTRTAVNNIQSHLALSLQDIEDLTCDFYEDILCHASMIIDQIQCVLRHPNVRMLFDSDSENHVAGILGDRILC